MRQLLRSPLAWTALALAAVAFAPGSVSAGSTTELTIGNSGINSYSGPYAQVDINLTSSTTANITFTSLTNGGNIYLMGGAQAFDLNVNATSFSVGTVTETNSGTGFSLTPDPTVNISPNNSVSTFNDFNLQIDNFDGFTHSVDSAFFTLTNTSGTWATANDVLTANADGHLAAAHIFVTTDPANASNTALATGYAAGDTVSAAPAPPSVVLLGLGAIGLGLGALVRRYRNRQPVLVHA